ncbi:MAG TPA: FAD-dependent oxidoreductase [Polyangiaceae bacterium]|nr:FAD-dependent oxidoreductase [Polyangiaceae bacterium]
MAKTPLFTSLRRLVATALQARCGREPSAEAGATLSRRELLGCGALPAAALVGCSASEGTVRQVGGTPAHRIAVIGAGLAGLHCAYRLEQAGVEVTLYEASQRVGGRVLTARDLLPGNPLCELGGEFIDEHHITMHALAAELDIALDDGLGDALPASAAQLWWVEGRSVSEATLLEQLSAVAPAMADALERAQLADNAEFEALDATPLSAWLAEHVPSARYPELFALLTSAYRGELGLETNQQSALNLMYLFGSSGTSDLRVLRQPEQRYRAREGNDTFTKLLAGKLRGSVNLESALLAVRQVGRVYVLSFRGPNGTGLQVEVDRVVFATPFSVLRKVELDVELSRRKRKGIAELGYGTNVKVVAGFSSRPWRQQGHTGRVTSDAPFQQVWDSSLGQRSTPTDPASFALTNLLGGDAGLHNKEQTPDAYVQSLLPELEQVFPGAQGAYVRGSAVRMHWPSARFFEGSDSCYRPRQRTDFGGSEGEREGNLHFCGEHCSVDFQGRMEGAAESGLFVAAEILEDLEVDLPSSVRELLAAKLVVRQPGYPSAGPLSRSLARRRAVLQAHEEFARLNGFRRHAKS